ncbi:hypothetical protein RI129_011186 [Pyrocoelia pectoralis]|uniref:Caspase family p20 domain-containing protein n=1 Tax=Pyrocoelia pectoralis TaxID=417401 RepID=A0AAN7V0J9_9COLE
MFESDGKPPHQENEKYNIPQKFYHPDQIEPITVPPSTELIPDEYEHCDNKKGLVLIFYSKYDVDNEQVIRSEFCDQGYTVLKNNVVALTNKDEVLRALDRVAKSDNVEKSCLIIFFLGIAEEGDKFLLDDEPVSHIQLSDVWIKFTANNCPAFRNKPKIFIFQACRKPTMDTFDSIKMTPQGIYDLPCEADMLIVYKVTDYQSRNRFVPSLCNKIDKYGLKDDIIGLITRTHDHKDVRPLIISTLTRKFYISSNVNRGHHFDLHDNHSKTIKALEDLHNQIQRKKVVQPRPSSSNDTSQVDSTKGKRKKVKTQTERPPWKH